MVISHVITSIDRKFGGPSYSVVSLLKALAKEEQLTVRLHTYSSQDPLVSNTEPLNFKVYFSRHNNPTGFLRWFTSDIKLEGVNLFHGHGLWQNSVFMMSRLALKNDIPYIISPRGMLAPWALQIGKTKKLLALKIFQRKAIENAACIHATSNTEAMDIRKLGFSNPIAVIPNGIDSDAFSQVYNHENSGRKKILMLSRLHPEKGVELLINSWGELDEKVRESWCVNIVGNGETDYVQQLNEQIDSKGLQNEVTIHGPEYGNDKVMRYQQADLFILPTSGENFGIVIAEALASGLPVITTKGAPWSELIDNQAGWWIDQGTTPLVQAMKDAMTLSDDKRRMMGANGRKLIEENYSIGTSRAKFVDLYKWLILNAEKPEFVLN